MRNQSHGTPRKEDVRERGQQERKQGSKEGREEGCNGGREEGRKGGKVVVGRG